MKTSLKFSTSLLAGILLIGIAHAFPPVSVTAEILSGIQSFLLLILIVICLPVFLYRYNRTARKTHRGFSLKR